MINQLEGAPVYDLGRTFERQLGDRVLKIARRSLTASTWRRIIANADGLLARSLEMWTIANAARVWARRANLPLTYEVMDIHGLLVEQHVVAKIAQAWERRALQRSHALLVSSPGFLRHHYQHLGLLLPRTILCENKMMVSAERASDTIIAGPPWRIAWFGVLRCTQSFDILLRLAREHPKLVTIDLRGRPTPHVQALVEKHLPLPNMRFYGPFSHNERDGLYAPCHFTWAIDYFEQGKNSAWLLPNRVYEGSFFRRPSIAQVGTETAEWIAKRHGGVILANPAADLGDYFVRLSSQAYVRMQQMIDLIPMADLVHTDDECRRVTQLIAGCHESIGRRHRIGVSL